MVDNIMSELRNINFTHYPPFFTHLTDVGGALNSERNLEGVINAVQDYSAAGSGVTRFWIAPGAGETYYVNRMLIQIEDAGTPGWSAAEYGSTTALTSGVVIQAQEGGTMVNITGAQPVKTNGGWGAHCFDIDHVNFGTGNEFLNVRWTFGKSGRPLKLVGDNGDFLEVLCGDDLTGLVGHRFVIQGYIKS
jgi:hypothetical protein